MKSLVEQHEGALIIKLKGRIDIGIGDVQLRHVLQDVERQHVNRVILDMGKVVHMDSSGMGELICQFTMLKESGIELVLTNLNTKVYNLMMITQMVTVFTIFDSNEDAMQMFMQAAA